MSEKLKVVLCWHMHQPEYRDPVSREFHLPWTYLHAIKDYVDMAAHLEAVPAARAVVNFVPTLLEQIEDYATQARAALAGTDVLRDPLLAALHGGRRLDDEQARQRLLRACLRVNEKRLINRFAPFHELAEMARWHLERPHTLRYLEQQFFQDCLVWYHLAWLGETVRRSDLRAKALIEKGRGYTVDDRRLLLELIAELLGAVIARYRALHERGQVELSVTPYAHPMVPLMLDFGCARDALPEARLPACPRYPSGQERAEWHLQEAVQTFERYFGFRPAGCWPAEGGVSSAALRLIGKHGFRWAASGETVLRNSVQRSGARAQAERHQGLHRPWRVDGGPLCCFFRSDGLSDLIGFSFADWHADDAVAHLLHQLENIAADCPRPSQRVVSIILDGENAWEFYPENGYYFLSALYEGLAAHPRLEMTTFSAVLDQGPKPGELREIVAGSWVYGTFSTWIGDKDKNRGWDMLCDAEAAFRRAVAAGRLRGAQLAAVQRQLAVCEGSDWFWWFGDYNPAESVRDFDLLYRAHLARLYHLLGEPGPEYLRHAFTHGGGAVEVGGTMRRGA